MLRDLVDPHSFAPNNFVDTGEGHSGMGLLSNLGVGLDPFSSAFTAILQPISQYLQAKEQSKSVDKQIALERSVLKEQKVENARSFAEQQAIDLAAVSARKRQEQVLGMYAVGGAALLLSVVFVYGAVKK